MKAKKRHYMLEGGEETSKILATSKVLGDDRKNSVGAEDPARTETSLQ